MRLLTCALILLTLNGCGFSLHSTEKNINFSSPENEYEAKEWNFMSEHVVDNMIEHKSIDFPNNIFTKKLKHSIIKLSFQKQYVLESKYVGIWPILPLFPYIKIGDRNSNDICKDKDIELIVEIIPNSNEIFSLPEYKLSNIYILKDNKMIFPDKASEEAIIINAQKYTKEKHKEYASYSTKLVFPLNCKDLNKSQLVIGKIVENKKNLLPIEVDLEYKKGSDKIYGIFIVAAIKAGFAMIASPFK